MATLRYRTYHWRKGRYSVPDIGRETVGRVWYFDFGKGAADCLSLTDLGGFDFQVFLLSAFCFLGLGLGLGLVQLAGY